MSGFAIRLLESALKGGLGDFLVISSLKLGVDHINLFQTKRALPIQLIKHMLILSLIIFCLFPNILELISFAKIIPRHIGIHRIQLHRIQILYKLPQQNHIVLYQIKRQTVTLLSPEIVSILIELQRVLHQKIYLVFLCL